MNGNVCAYVHIKLKRVTKSIFQFSEEYVPDEQESRTVDTRNKPYNFSFFSFLLTVFIMID